MRRLQPAALLLTVLILVLTDQATAFIYSGYKWDDSYLPLTYKINLANKPSYLTSETLITTVQQGFQAWNNVECSDMEFLYDGLTIATDDYQDNIRSISWNATGADMGNALAITWQWTNFYGDRLIDADIEINGGELWSVSGEVNKYDIQSVITHEAGHFLSLDDLYDDVDQVKTMYGYLDAGDTGPRTLDPDDEAGICFIYPANELTILTTSLPKAILTYPYSQQLRAGGGMPPYNWNVISGAIPDGLSLNEVNGIISGTPQAEGDFSFTVQVTDTASASKTRDLTIVVSAINQPDIFGIEVGNLWTYQGTYQGSSYTNVEEIVSLDQTTFPTTTYIFESREDGSWESTEWYEKTSSELRLWGNKEEDAGEILTSKFSKGFLVAWYPIEVGDHRESSGTMEIAEYPGFVFNISLTVDVAAKETVTLDIGTLEAYKLKYVLSWWGYDEGETETFYQWIVPYLGVVKYEDDKGYQEELTSFTIGGGTISQDTDADNDGLKDYQELVVYGTYWQEADTDGDGCEDGAEVSGGRNPILPDPQGDLNDDCIVDLQDAIIALQIQSAITPISSIDLIADVNADGEIGLAEVICIMQKVAGVRQ